MSTGSDRILDSRKKSGRIERATDVAHLLKTHPDTEYDGQLYAASLGMNFSEGDPQYRAEKQAIEQKLEERFRLFERKYQQRHRYDPEDWLNDELADMADELEKLERKKSERFRIFERAYEYLNNRKRK